jgi:hypothetical protein
MRRYVLAILGLVTAACDNSGTVTGGPDASRDGPTVSTDATTDSGDAGGPDPCADAGPLPSSLSCTGLYSDFAAKVVAPGAVAYTPATPLWSDGAQKQRWIELPPNTQIDVTNPDEWTFPLGTKLFKEFRVDGKRVETRLFYKTATNVWSYGTYAWNADDSYAIINYGGPVPVGDAGVTWTIPSNEDCDECHRGRQDHILGFEQVGLGLPGAQGLTLAQLVAQGLVTPAPSSVSLTIGDDGTGLDSLAYGWLHVNCGVTCHNSNPAAVGYGAGMLLRLHPDELDGGAPNATWDIVKTTIDVPCVSGISTGDRIVPGAPQDSVLYQLIDERGQQQMPPIGTNLVDVPDVAVIHAWIAALGSGDGGTTTTTDAGPEGGGSSEGGTGPADAGPGDAAPGDAQADGGIDDGGGD